MEIVSLYSFHVDEVVACLLSPFSSVWLFAALWTIALQVPLFRGLSRQEYWGGLPFPPPRDIPNQEPASPGLAGLIFTSEPQGKPS